jgi:hypothetical protein
MIYSSEILHYIGAVEKKYMYRLKIIYVLPGHYMPGKIENNLINESIFHDLHENKEKYDIPEYYILSSDYMENVYVYIPDHNRIAPISFTFGKSKIYLRILMFPTKCVKIKLHLSLNFIHMKAWVI